MNAGEYAELDGGFWTHYSARGEALARVEAAKTPALKGGRNSVAFDGGEKGRAEVTLFALGMGALFFVHDDAQRAFVWPSIWIFLGFCLLFACLCSRRLGRLCSNLMAKVLPQKIHFRLDHMFNRFQYFRSFRLWVQISLLSAVTQSLRIFVHYFCGIVVGVDLSISWYFYYIPLVAIVSALPISIGGFGPREFLAQSLFAKAGVASLESVVIQLLAYFVSLLLSLFGAFVFLLGDKPEHPKVKAE
jgi:uncharacterized membrane protein YbhN (UPF0104 family)